MNLNIGYASKEEVIDKEWATRSYCSRHELVARASRGKQWESKGIADNIESQVQQQIKDMGIKIPPNSNIPNDLMMNVKL